MFFSEHSVYEAYENVGICTVGMLSWTSTSINVMTMYILHIILHTV